MKPGPRVLLVMLVILVSFCSYGQAGSSRLADLYTFVEKADSIQNKSQRTFYLEKFLNDDFNYRETWRYSMNGDRVICFQVDYMLDSTEFTEVYYLNRGRLVCSEEYEKVNYSLLEDELRYGGIYYFESAIPKHVVQLGRRTRNGYMNEETQVLSRFEKRFNELKRHLPMLP